MAGTGHHNDRLGGLRGTGDFAGAASGASIVDNLHGK